MMIVSPPPSAIKVGLFLCLVSLGFGLLLYAVEYIVGTEVPGTGVLSTVLPALLTGMWFGYQSGELMPSKTRLKALLIWFVVSFTYMLVLAKILGVSLYELAMEFGWFNLLLLFVLVITVVAAYFILKSGEKTGIKSLQNSKEKQAKIES